MNYPPEALESRIAPAVFFLAGNSLEIHDRNGVVVTPLAADLTASGADSALLLNAGDSIVYDLNGNHKFDAATDFRMFAVSAGRAKVFFTDFNHNLAFDISEFTGVAAGDGLVATLVGELHGPIAAQLTAAGTFVGTTLQDNSIAGLTLNGWVIGPIVAGGKISDVVANVPAGSDLGRMNVTGGIFAGTGALGTALSYKGGPSAKILSTFNQTPGEAGASISRVTLPGGTSAILAGDGADSSTGLAGMGGGLSDITLGGSSSLVIRGGNGGDGLASGIGAPGGSIARVNLGLVAPSFLSLRAGDGGSSAVGDGAAGGNFSKLTVSVAKPLLLPTEFIAGNGGAGGTAGGTGKGGDGGGVLRSSFTLPKSADEVLIAGGAGGLGGSDHGQGGVGGALRTLTVVSAGSPFNDAAIALHDLKLAGGAGGGAGFNGGTGGVGGAIADVNVTTTGVLGGNLAILAGDATTIAGIDNGGNGGAITGVTVTTADVRGFVSILGGAGARSGSGGLNGGHGGSVSGVAFTNVGYVGSGVAGGLQIGSGIGGRAVGNAGNAGNGGDVSGITVINKGGMTSLSIGSASGGDVTAFAGTSGNSGAVSTVTVRSFADIAETAFIGSAAGGSFSGLAGGNGGRAGDVRDIFIKDRVGSTATWKVAAGPGGSGLGAGGKGGNGGLLRVVTIDAPLSTIQLGAPDVSGAGGTGAGGIGGAGSSVINVKGTANELRIFGGDGGASTDAAAGAGGGISAVDFSVNRAARIIAAGRGGDTTTGTTGAGGSIVNVVIRGDIGDFSSFFDTSFHASPVGMGGLVTGLGGLNNGTTDTAKNGTITNVTATRVAAIVAGRTTGAGLSVDNFVPAITGLNASVLGADVTQDRLYSFYEGMTTVADFQLPGAADPDDIAQDGLIIVKAGGFTPPAGVVPFKVVSV